MKLKCDGLDVSIRTVSIILGLSIIDTIEYIKEQKRYFILDGFKVFIEKPFANRMELSAQKKGYGNTLAATYNYIYDGKTMLFNKTLREIAGITGKSISTTRQAHDNFQNYFISGEYLISNIDFRGQEHKIKLCASNGNRYFFGMLPVLIKNTKIVATRKTLTNHLHRYREYKKGDITIWKNL